MKVYLFRHGEYDTSSPEQGLSANGASAVRQTAALLKQQGANIDEIWCSPKRRAVESAQIISQVFECRVTRETTDLLPEASVEHMIKDLQPWQTDVALVSHLPLIPNLLTQMFFGKTFPSAFFSTASVAVVERSSAGWVFLHMVYPE